MTLLIPEGDTLVTYYILPLLEINKKTFGRSFKRSYINQSGTKVFVELYHPMVSPSYKYNKNYETDVITEEINFAIFKIPTQWRNDASYFIKGAYSQMSKEAKKLIYATSTLPYNVKMENFTMSHPVLQALAKTKILREFLFTYLEVEQLAESGELIEKPTEDWFIEHRIKELNTINNV